MFNYSNLWTFPANHMDVCKEKYYGNTYRCPEHFGEPKKLEYHSSPGHSSYLCFILFQRVRVGILTSSQLSAKFSPISQLSSKFLAISQWQISVNIFPSILYSWIFYLKNPKRILQSVSDVQRRWQQHDCFWRALNYLDIINVKIVSCNT